MTAVILQARLDSSRLPRKALLPLEGRPLIFRVMEALKRLPAGIHILACPEDSVPDFKAPAEQAEFELFPGSKDDVLGRYCGAIRRFQVDFLIRATGDNPFVFIDAAEAINREGLEHGAAYAGYYGLPHGAGVEAVAAEALLRAEREAVLASEREHVCPYLYNHGELFRIHRPLAPALWQGLSLRVTVDTQEDYERAQLLSAALSRTCTGDERYQGAAIIDAYQKTVAGNGMR
jgi:spore coat polysaccharide biosynthesis protein SpsF